MPIRFEQPAPMAPDIVANAGRAEVMQRMAGPIAGMYEAAMRTGAQASADTARLAAGASEAQARLNTEGAMHDASLRQRGREFAISQQVSPRDQFMAEQERAQIQERAVTAGWLQSQDISQAETMRLQRLQGQVGAVLADPNLGPEEKHNLITQLKTGIDPLKQRLEATREKMIMQEQNKLMHANAQALRLEQMDAQQRSQHFQQTRTFIGQNPDGTVEIDPETKQPQRYFLNSKGDPELWPPREKGADLEAKMALKGQYTPASYSKAVQEIEALVEKRADKMGFDETPDGRAERLAWVHESVKGTIRDRGMPATMEGLNEWNAKVGKAAAPPPPNNVPPPPGPTGKSANLPIPQQGGGPEPLAPFDPFNPESVAKAAPLQQAWINGLTERRAEVSQRADLPEKLRWDAEDAASGMKELLGRHGSFEAMPDSEKAKWAKLKKVLANLPRDPNPKKFMPAFNKAFSEAGDFGGHS